MKKVLIIEDDRDTLDAIHYLVEDLNLEVVNSPNILLPAEIKEVAPDLIFLDHWVGRKLGGDLCFALKADPMTKTIPVIIISAHNNIKTIAEQSCADGYLPKPFDIEEIEDLIKRFLGDW